MEVGVLWVFDDSHIVAKDVAKVCLLLVLCSFPYDVVDLVPFCELSIVVINVPVINETLIGKDQNRGIHIMLKYLFSEGK